MSETIGDFLNQTKQLAAKNNHHAAVYANSIFSKILQAVGVSKTYLKLQADKIDSDFFDAEFTDCPYRVFPYYTWKTLSLLDFFWKPTKSELWDIYDNALDLYAGWEGGIVDRDGVSLLAVVWHASVEKCNVVMYELNPRISDMDTGCSMLVCKVRNKTFIFEKLDSFCNKLRGIWTPSA